MTQYDLFGNCHNTTPIEREVEEILEVSDSARRDTEKFAMLYLKRRAGAWFSALPSDKRTMLADIVHRYPSADRERRRLNELDEQAKR